jgi:hypothetical protein
MMPGAVLLLVVAFGQAGDGSDDASPHKRWINAYRGIAESITMRRQEAVLTMLPQPLHFYTNPVRMNDQHGAIFLWTEVGRPAVIAAIWSAMNRQNPDVRFVTHEWHSLSIDPTVTATRDGVNLWTSGEPGIAWSKLENSPPPAASRPQRLVQMRALARRFSVAIDVQEESDLRLMGQPLFRYPEAVEGVLDGAIFAFAMATDPELLLWLEARQVAGQPEWQIAFARFGNKAMTVKDGDRAVWSCQAGAPGYSDGKYYLHWRAQEMPAKPEM